MPTLKFFVRTESKSKTKFVKIRARFRDGQRIDLFADTQQIVKIKDWNNKKGTPILRANNNYDELTETLDQIRREVFKRYQVETTVTKDWLNNTIDRVLHPKKYDESLTFFEFVEKFIDDANTQPNYKTGRVVSYGQIGMYKRTFRYLKEFCEKYRNGRELTYNDFDLNFYDDYMHYFYSKDFATNTIGKQIQTLKTFLNAANEKGNVVNPAYKSKRFKSISEESDSIYLNEEELNQIYECEFQNRTLDRVRDIYIVAAWTGLRFSDVSTLPSQNISDEFIELRLGKTENPVIIPLHWTVKEILDKHGNQLPKAMSNKNFNLYLKQVAKQAGIKGSVTKSITKGGVQVKQDYEKWELVCSHSGRRSFATNLYLADFPALSIMHITGHTTEKSFLKYIKVTPKEHAEKLRKHWIKQASHLKSVKNQ